jgi:hypothetical protein
VTLAISPLNGSGRIHASVSCSSIRPDLELLCRLAAEVVPEPIADETRLADGGLLHVVGTGEGLPQGGAERRARLLYGAVARQRPAQEPTDEPEPRLRSRSAYFEPSV